LTYDWELWTKIEIKMPNFLLLVHWDETWRCPEIGDDNLEVSMY
jgi:hypothetical protein